MTSLALSYETESAANPLDLVEQVIAANEWAFDRRSDAEMAAEAKEAAMPTAVASGEMPVKTLVRETHIPSFYYLKSH